MPGVVTGALLVFIPMCGEFIVPNILGGGRFEFVGNAIGDTFASAQNWLEARANGQGATGSILGAIFFVNRGGSSCGLRGYPAVLLLDPTGAILDVRVSAAQGDEPLVVLRPGGFGEWTPLTRPPVESAYVTYDWLNWCGAQGAVGFRVSLPNGRGTLDAPFISHAATVVGAPGAKPRCDAPDGSFMGVGPFHFSDDVS